MTYAKGSLGKDSTVLQDTYIVGSSGTPRSLRVAGNGRRTYPKMEKLKKKKRKKNKKKRR